MRNTEIMYDSAEKTPVVLPETEELLPPLTEEQLSALEADIARNGCYSPVVVNQDMVVIDGHNRKKLCEKHGVPYKIAVFEFADLLEAKQWALEAQKGRRNLDKWELGKIALKLKPELAARAKANMSVGGSKKKSAPQGESDAQEADAEQDDGLERNGDQVSDPAVERIIALERKPKKEQEGLRKSATLVAEKVNTRQRMAEAVGLSADMMGKIMKIDEYAPEVVRDALDKKEISVNQAYSVTRYLQQFPENERENQARIAMKLSKAGEEIRKNDEKIESRTKTAGLFIKAFASCIHLKPTEENVACWVDCTRMTRRAIQNAINEAKDYSEVFAAIAEILEQMLDAGAGDDALIVLARKRETDQASQNNDNKEEQSA